MFTPPPPPPPLPPVAPPPIAGVFVTPAALHPPPLPQTTTTTTKNQKRNFPAHLFDNEQYPALPKFLKLSKYFPTIALSPGMNSLISELQIEFEQQAAGDDKMNIFKTDFQTFAKKLPVSPSLFTRKRGKKTLPFSFVSLMVHVLEFQIRTRIIAKKLKQQVFPSTISAAATTTEASPASVSSLPYAASASRWRYSQIKLQGLSSKRVIDEALNLVSTLFDVLLTKIKVPFDQLLSHVNRIIQLRYQDISSFDLEKWKQDPVLKEMPIDWDESQLSIVDMLSTNVHTEAIATTVAPTETKATSSTSFPLVLNFHEEQDKITFTPRQVGIIIEFFMNNAGFITSKMSHAQQEDLESPAQEAPYLFDKIKTDADVGFCFVMLSYLAQQASLAQQPLIPLLEHYVAAMKLDNEKSALGTCWSIIRTVAVYCMRGAATNLKLVTTQSGIDINGISTVLSVPSFVNDELTVLDYVAYVLKTRHSHQLPILKQYAGLAPLIALPVDICSIFLFPHQSKAVKHQKLLAELNQFILDLKKLATTAQICRPSIENEYNVVERSIPIVDAIIKATENESSMTRVHNVLSQLSQAGEISSEKQSTHLTTVRFIAGATLRRSQKALLPTQISPSEVYALFIRPRPKQLSNKLPELTAEELEEENRKKQLDIEHYVSKSPAAQYVLRTLKVANKYKPESVIKAVMEFDISYLEKTHVNTQSSYEWIAMSHHVIPSDCLAKMLQFFRLDEVLSFSSTCKAAYYLCHSRSMINIGSALEPLYYAKSYVTPKYAAMLNNEPVIAGASSLQQFEFYVLLKRFMQPLWNLENNYTWKLMKESTNPLHHQALAQASTFSSNQFATNASIFIKVFEASRSCRFLLSSHDISIRVLKTLNESKAFRKLVKLTIVLGLLGLKAKTVKAPNSFHFNVSGVAQLADIRYKDVAALELIKRLYWDPLQAQLRQEGLEQLSFGKETDVLRSALHDVLHTKPNEGAFLYSFNSDKHISGAINGSLGAVKVPPMIKERIQVLLDFHAERTKIAFQLQQVKNQEAYKMFGDQYESFSTQHAGFLKRMIQIFEYLDAPAQLEEPATTTTQV